MFLFGSLFSASCSSLVPYCLPHVPLWFPIGLEVHEAIVILHLFDNSIYNSTVDGESAEPLKLNGKFHIIGDLQVGSGHQIKQLFELAMPIIRAASGSRIILLGPLPRYVVVPCMLQCVRTRDQLRL